MQDERTYPRIASRSWSVFEKAATVAIAGTLVAISQAQSSESIEENTAKLQVDPIAQALSVELSIQGLTVHYSSTSTYRGLFGFGWCSALDGRIVAESSGLHKRVLYYGCDQRDSAMLDPRLSGLTVEQNGLGFFRVDELGRRVEYDTSGRVARVGRLAVDWQANLVRIRRVDQAVILVGTVRERVDRVDSIQRLWGDGVDRLFRYSQDGLMISDGLSTFQYNDDHNMTDLVTFGFRARFEYDNQRDRLLRATRWTPNGVESLGLSARGGDDGKVLIEMKRGAEMRPVCFIYDRKLKSLEIDGDRSLAPQLIDWLTRGE